jgi:hypothetical protein
VRAQETEKRGGIRVNPHSSLAVFYVEQVALNRHDVMLCCQAWLARNFLSNVISQIFFRADLDGAARDRRCAERSGDHFANMQPFVNSQVIEQLLADASLFADLQPSSTHSYFSTFQARRVCFRNQLIVFEKRNSSRLSDSAVCISSARAAVPERRPRVLRSNFYLQPAARITGIALPACAEADNDAPAKCARHLKQRQWSSRRPPH